VVGGAKRTVGKETGWQNRVNNVVIGDWREEKLVRASKEEKIMWKKGKRKTMNETTGLSAKKGGKCWVGNYQPSQGDFRNRREKVPRVKGGL